VRSFEDVMVEELAGLVRAGVPIRGVHLTVRKLFVARIERRPLGPREVSQAVEAMVRAACRLVQEVGAPEELVETVCRATLETVRGHGGETARWFSEATSRVGRSGADLPPAPSGRHPSWIGHHHVGHLG
jgi:hypothetical protein